MRNYLRHEWVEKLWAEAERASKGKTGPQVVRALANASDRVWMAGLDHAFAETRGRTLHDRAVGFDATWLSFFVAELRR